MRMGDWSLFCGVICVVAGVLSFSARADGQAPATQPSAKVLYQKALPGGQELVFTKDAMVPVSAVADLVSPELVAPREPYAAPVIGFATLSAEIRLPTSPPLRLWSQTAPLYLPTDYDECKVLDALVMRDRIVFVQASAGSVIGVREIKLPGLPRSAGLGGWSRLAALVPAAPGRLGAKIALDKATKAIRIEVTDTLDGVCQHTVFVEKEKPGDWQFERVRQWEEKVAAGK